MAGKKQRQRKLARERYQRRLVRQAHRDRRTRQWTVAITAVIVVAGLSVGGVLLAGKSSGTATTPKATPSATASPTPTAEAEPATHCTYTAAGTAARKVSLPSATPDYKATYTATINTNLGAIVIDLLNSKATCTVNSFVHLAEADFYNSSPCFRLTTSGFYILQCGDPTGKGTGGPGYEFASENLTGATYTAGTVAMANVSGEADSNGSQFFLVYKDSSELGPDYTPFGKIVSGLNILQTVAKAGYGKPLSSGGGGAPKEKIEIESVSVKQT